MNSINAQEVGYENHLLTISAAMDEFEGYAQPHGSRVAKIADALAQKFNFASHDSNALGQAALIHDVGELVMNRDYIKANRVLREEERIDLQRHTVIGEQEAARRGLSRAVQLLVRWHHEWWNGGGYPDALVGEQIPLAARILRLADTYASMTEARPHRAAISAAEAKRYLIEWAGIEFDPKIVKHFLLLNSADYELRATKVESNEKTNEPIENESPIDFPPNDDHRISQSQINEQPITNEQPVARETSGEQEFADHRTPEQTLISESQTVGHRTDEETVNSELLTRH